MKTEVGAGIIEKYQMYMTYCPGKMAVFLHEKRHAMAGAGLADRLPLVHI
jgi:hypothetical protein